MDITSLIHQDDAIAQKRIMSTFQNSSLAIALTLAAGCDDDGTQERIDERSRPPAVSTQCGVETLSKADGTHREIPRFYYFDHINEELARDPELRAHVGLDEVSTCTEAERFAAAQRAYDGAHSFDESEELPVVDAQPAEEVAPRILAGDPVVKRGVVRIGTDCSGVFITHRHILTAAKCFGLGGGGAQQISIQDGEDAAVRDGYVHIYSGYSGWSDVNDDIAVISLWNDLPWTPTPHRFYTGTTNLGTDLQIYGYGTTHNFNSSGEGELHRGQDGTPININYHTDGYFRATAHTAKLCAGDLGGPAIDESFTYPITWGLASTYGPFGDGNCADIYSYMRWTKTNVKATWIAARLAENLDGDFNCTQYDYNSNGSYFRCW